MGRPDFKSGEGCKTALGGFDSCLLRQRQRDDGEADEERGKSSRHDYRDERGPQRHWLQVHDDGGEARARCPIGRLVRR